MTIKEIPSSLMPDNSSIEVFLFHDGTNRGLQRNEQEYDIKVDNETNANFNLGIRILETTGAIDAAKELIEAVKTEFPDARFRDYAKNELGEPEEVKFEKGYSGFLVQTHVLWGKKSEQGWSSEYWKSLSIGMRVLTKELVIAGADARVIPEEVWSTKEGKEVIEGSIINAFLNPAMREEHDLLEVK